MLNLEKSCQLLLVRTLRVKTLRVKTLKVKTLKVNLSWAKLSWATFPHNLFRCLEEEKRLLEKQSEIFTGVFQIYKKEFTRVESLGYKLITILVIDTQLIESKHLQVLVHSSCLISL